MNVWLEGGWIIRENGVEKNPGLMITDDVIDFNQNRNHADEILILRKNDWIYPGLFNAHDHLLGTYYPKVGHPPYINWLPWDNDLKSAPLYAERGKIPNQDLYYFGAYRNLLAGTTTVSDHMPHVVNDMFNKDLPVRVPKEYALQHESSSYDLKWGGTLTEEHRIASEKNWPFITHLEEGHDEEAHLGINILEEMNVLDEYTVMIHGIAFSKEDIRKISERGAHVVWCPSSNWFMFHETTDIEELLAKGVNVSLGTDSPMSGGLNIVDEMKFAKRIYYQLTGKKLAPEILYKMVTVSPAKALRMDSLGEISQGKKADLLVLKGLEGRDPYQSLTEFNSSQMRLLWMEGKLLYATSAFFDFIGQLPYHYQKVRVNRRKSAVIGKPFDLYQKMRESVGFRKVLPFFLVDKY